MASEEKVTAEMSFEEALAALNDVVTELEKGDLPLDEAIACYEKGAEMAALCERKLQTAELRVREWQAAEA